MTFGTFQMFEIYSRTIEHICSGKRWSLRQNSLPDWRRHDSKPLQICPDINTGIQLCPGTENTVQRLKVYRITNVRSKIAESRGEATWIKNQIKTTNEHETNQGRTENKKGHRPKECIIVSCNPRQTRSRSIPISCK